LIVHYGRVSSELQKSFECRTIASPCRAHKGSKSKAICFIDVFPMGDKKLYEFYVVCNRSFAVECLAIASKTYQRPLRDERQLCIGAVYLRFWRDGSSVQQHPHRVNVPARSGEEERRIEPVLRIFVDCCSLLDQGSNRCGRLLERNRIS
jgi:hypothetical protein